MALDAIVIRNLARELDQALGNIRIDKIHQPGRFDLRFVLRPRDLGVKRLVFSLADRPRVYLTPGKSQNPEKAPMFCMLLRKYLTGAKILSVTQPGLERILLFKLACTDELFNLSEKTLVAELTGRHSNLILAGDDNRIIDCLRRVDAEMSPKRQVLPGLFYALPPAPEAPAVDEVTKEQFIGMLRRAPADLPADRWLMESFLGLSPLLCREIAFRAAADPGAPLSAFAGGGEDALYGHFRAAADGLHTGTPLLFARPGEDAPFEFSFLPVTQYGPLQTTPFSSWSELLSAFFDRQDEIRALTQEKQTLARPAAKLRDRLARKLAEQRLELAKAQDREALRRAGDLLMAHLHLVTKGQDTVSLPDLFCDTRPLVEIPLDVRASPHENARRYYKEYAKMKNAETVLTREIQSGESELLYLESVLDEIQRAEDSVTLAEIKDELILSGHFPAPRDRKQGQKKAAAPLFSPYAYKTRSGFTVLAGRNNRENETLTLKTASRDDVWFHVKNAPGAHAVLFTKGKRPADGDLTDAAVLAAFHSKLHGSSLVPVDYTEVRHVKKPGGSRPGMVLYEHYKTAYVTPDKAAVSAMAEAAEKENGRDR